MKSASRLDFSEGESNSQCGGSMKLTEAQIRELTTLVFSEWKAQRLINFKISEAKAGELVQEILRKENLKVEGFEKEIRVMLETLEGQSPSGFDRHKMYLLLRQRLAKEKGIIL